MLEDLPAHCSYVYFRSERWRLILGGSAESVACYASDTALATGPDPKPVAIKWSKVMSTQHKEIVIVACPRITLGSLSQLALEGITQANESYQNTKVSDVGWWCFLELISMQKHNPCHVCAQHWAIMHPDTSILHMAALVRGAAGPPATTLLPGHCGQELPLPCPSSRCNPPWITRGHDCQNKCPNCPLSPDQDKSVVLKKLKKANCWKARIAAWCQLPLEGGNV